MPEVIALRYVGEGAYRPSLPARDLDRADIASVAAVQKRSSEDLVAEALGCGLYRAIWDVEPAAAAQAAAEGAEPSPLTKAQLLERATELGLSFPARATNAVITAAIAAEEARLAEEAAVEPEAQAAAPVEADAEPEAPVA